MRPKPAAATPACLLHDWSRVLPRFWQVVPKEYVKYLPVALADQVQALTA